ALAHKLWKRVSKRVDGFARWVLGHVPRLTPHTNEPGQVGSRQLSSDPGDLEKKPKKELERHGKRLHSDLLYRAKHPEHGKKKRRAVFTQGDIETAWRSLVKPIPLDPSVPQAPATPAVMSRTALDVPEALIVRSLAGLAVGAVTAIFYYIFVVAVPKLPLSLA